MIRRAALLLVTAAAGAAALAAGACSDTSSTAVGSLNLDRPVDISFACYGDLRITNGGSADPSQPVEATAQPLASCDFRAQEVITGQPQPVPPGQEDLSKMGGTAVTAPSYYGFILESAPGVVAIAKWDSTKSPIQFMGGEVSVIDANPLTPGDNGISVGDFPVAIASDKVGCFELTANAGSCDMSELSINTALGDPTKIHVDKLAVKNAAGQPLLAKPAAMVAEPPAGTIGVECPATPTGLVYVAYPGCHLVAAIDSSSGTVVGGIQFDASGNATFTNGNVTCPNECGGEAGSDGPRPVALDLKHDPRSDRRALLIGAENSNTLTIVDLDNNYMPLMQHQVPLEQEDPKNPLGISQVTLSPQIGMGGSSGALNDDGEPQFQFAYAVASDRSVRVADVLNLYKECDAEVDPRYLHDVKDVSKLSCMPVGDPATPPRREGAHSPGIELTTNGVPTSVAVFRVPTYDGDMRPQDPFKLIGYFGVITSSNGFSYMFNIDDDNQPDYVGGMMGASATNVLASQIPLDIPHQLRDAIADRGAIAQTSVNGVDMVSCDDPGPNSDPTNGGTGSPRSPTLPQRAVPNGYVSSDKQFELPSIRQVLCTGADDTKPVPEIMFPAPIEVRDLVFPDLRAMRSAETWYLTWEGLLSLDQASTAVDGPPIREGDLVIDSSGMHLVDQTKPFCNAGVEVDDIVQLRGCDPSQGDAQCPEGYSCYVHPESKVAGLGACMATDEADRLATACKAFLTTLRRYTVGRATTGELILVPRKHELRTTPIDGCTSDQQCQMLANYAAQNASSANPVDDKTPPDPHHYTCAVDPARGPSTIKRCLESCTMDSDCEDGYACENGFCMEGVVPPQACVNAPQRYDLRASDAFVVIGSKSGYIHPIIAGPGDVCMKDPNANPLRVGRIPLTAPACDPTANPRTGQRPDGTYEPNPCETTVTQSELDPAYLPGTCTAANPATVLTSRQADAIQFRNRGLTLTVVDPTYPGDAQCIGDRMGNLGRVPLVDNLYQLLFQTTPGFLPLTLGTQDSSFPVKVVNGPGQSIWIVDEGDFLSSDLGTASTLGKVYRIESQNLSTINVAE